MKYPVKRGEIYQLGSHRLMCADIINDDTSELFNQKIRSIVTDPPYGIAYTENRSVKPAEMVGTMSVDREIANDKKQSNSEYAVFTKEWIQKVRPHLADYNSVYIFNAEQLYCALRQGMELADIYYSQMIVWIKGGGGVGLKDYLVQQEFIAYGWYGRHKMERTKDKSVIFFPKPSKSKLHPTTKPVGLIRRLILNSTKIGDVVCDPFGGSGTTLIACEHTNRKCIMTEIDPVYCDVIIQRWEKLTGGKAVKL